MDKCRDACKSRDDEHYYIIITTTTGKVIYYAYVSYGTRNEDFNAIQMKRQILEMGEE